VRVLHVQKVKGLGGSERHLLELLPALASRGHDVRMLVLTTGEWHRFAEPLAARGVELEATPAGLDLDPRPAFAVGRVIRAFDPDVVHTHLIHADVHGQLAARRARVPGVSTAHNLNPRVRRRLVRRIAQRAGHDASRTIAISEHVRMFVEELAIPRPGTVRVVPYGIELEGRRPDRAARAAARTGYGICDDDVAVTIAARLIEGKGHDVLLDAVAVAAHRVPNLRLFVAGDGPLRAPLETRARALPGGVVRFLGFVEDPRELIGASDLVAFPTLPNLGEGFGLSALEAMAAGVPVVASDAGALPEVVIDGETGLVVRGGAVEPLAEALAQLAGDAPERARLGAAGLARAKERFSLDSMVDGTLAVYEEAVRDAPAGAAVPR
jgi:glycosyltransferase involved in cell wall biosynthesis